MKSTIKTLSDAKTIAKMREDENINDACNSDESEEPFRQHQRRS